MTDNTYFIIECIFYFIHLSVLILLIIKCGSVFKGAFYNIFRIVLIADLFVFIITNIIHTLSKIPIFTNLFATNGYVVSAIYCSSSYFTVMQFIGHFLMAFNRFTLIWTPIKHRSIWRKHWYTFALLLIPFLNICWRLHEKVVLEIRQETVFAKFSNPSILPLITTLLSTIYISTTLMTAILNLLSFFRYRFRNQFSSNNSQSQITSSVESSLMFVTCIAFIAQILRTSNTVRQVLFPDDEYSKILFQAALPYFNDIFAWSSSLLLLLLSQITRREYANLYFCQKKFNVHLIPTAPTSIPLK